MRIKKINGQHNLSPGIMRQTKNSRPCSFGSLGRFALPSLAAAAILLLSSACGVGPSDDEESVQPVVRTERLEIVDGSGNIKALLTTIENGRPSLTLIDSAGEFRAWLYLSSDDTPNLILVDSGRMVLMDQNGEIRSTRRLDRNGEPILTFRDANGAIRSMSRLGEDGAPIVELYDETGQPVWSAP